MENFWETRKSHIERVDSMSIGLTFFLTLGIVKHRNKKFKTFRIQIWWNYFRSIWKDWLAKVSFTVTAKIEPCLHFYNYLAWYVNAEFRNCENYLRTMYRNKESMCEKLVRNKLKFSCHFMSICFEFPVKKALVEYCAWPDRFRTKQIF